MSKTEFDQLLSLSSGEQVFNLLDTSANGLICGIEIFTILGYLSECRTEDKVRYLVDLYDFNQRGYLEEVDIEFMIYNIL